ncbi:dodecin family protein [Dokdonella sp.]|uniref:dodecin family protein n=1 Tax=Dokdonella sp. TaxID=2291710 RepID=UPI002F3EDE13
MSNVAKVIEINAGSKKSFDDAVRTGLSKVAETIGNVRGAWISDTKVVTTPDGDIEEWRVCMRVTFVVE